MTLIYVRHKMEVRSPRKILPAVLAEEAHPMVVSDLHNSSRPGPRIDSKSLLTSVSLSNKGRSETDSGPEPYQFTKNEKTLYCQNNADRNLGSPLLNRSPTQQL